MKKRSSFLQIPENAVFWLMLLFLAFGSAASLYGKLSGRAAAAESGRILSPIYQAPGGTAEAASDASPASTAHVLASPALLEAAGIDLSDLMSFAPPAPCELRPANTALRP